MPHQTKNLMYLAIGNATDRDCDNDARAIRYLDGRTGSRPSRRKVRVTRKHKADLFDWAS